MSTPCPKTIDIIGGGFTGTSIAVLQAQHYQKLQQQGHDLPPVLIRLIDRNDAFGTGLPYATQDDVFLLNQPASAMSPFPDDPEHFTRWLQSSGDTFATRHQYGEYLKETLRDTFNCASGIRLETVNACIDALPATADATIIATGHERNGFLTELCDTPGFFCGTYKVDDVRRFIAKNNPQHIGIIGTGQSMVDALAVLDSVGYSGRITAFSHDGIEPWPYDPADYTTPARYTAAFLAPHSITDWSAESLVNLLHRECENVRQQGFAIGHLLGAIDFDALRAAAPAENGIQRLCEVWKKIYGNPTAPERYALFTECKNSGRLQIVKGGIRKEDIQHAPEGFAVALAGGKLAVSALFNAVAYDRRSAASPLICDGIAQDRIVECEPVAAGQQKDPRLFVAGPPVSPQKWGVETFRDNNAHVARRSLETALGLAS